MARRIRILLGHVWSDKSVWRRHETPGRFRLSIVRSGTENVYESTEFMQGCREGCGGAWANVLMEPLKLTRNLNIFGTEDLL